MIQLKTGLKKIFCRLLQLFLVVFGKIRFRENPESFKKIAILFFPNLGMGDLTMLSPGIQKLAEIFPDSEIFLVNDFSEFISFSKIKKISRKEYFSQRKNFDLIISPSLSLRHFWEIFFARFWIGYFAWPVSVSNFKSDCATYDPESDHYLKRMTGILKLLSLDLGKELEKAAEEKKLSYPELKISQPDFFERELLGKRYGVFAPYSQWPDRQWPIENFFEIMKNLLRSGKLEKAVVIGKGEREEFLNEELKKLSTDLSDKIIFAFGKTSILETVFLIKNSYLFVGLDSGPAHFAYLTAPRVLPIFINVDPLWRLPLKSGNLIAPIVPSGEYRIYSGWSKADQKICRKLVEKISVEKVEAVLEKIL